MVGRGEQAILFLNRRGHTRTLICAGCGSAVGCPNCSVALVLHRAGRERLRCHLCGHDEAPRDSVRGVRSGEADRVRREAPRRWRSSSRRWFRRRAVARLDRDAAGGPGQAAAVLARFARRELDVLVGTQMVAKGHDFPGVTLVGVLDADGPLHLPDFRAAERCVQLLTQVAGRAGRGLAPGRVLVQAFRPEAVSLDYAGFAAAELQRREQLHFPPFARLLAVRLQGNSEPAVRGAAERLRRDRKAPAGARRARRRARPRPGAARPHPWQAPLATAAPRAATTAPLHRLGRALRSRASRPRRGARPRRRIRRPPLNRSASCGIHSGGNARLMDILTIC